VGADGISVGGVYIEGYSQGGYYGDDNGNFNRISSSTGATGTFSIGVMTELTVKL
jgi:hypothetical protein